MSAKPAGRWLPRIRGSVGARSGLPRWAGAVSGAAAVGVTLAVGELFDGLSARIASLVVAVGDFLIDSASSGMTRAAIRLFGTNDKPALIVAIVAVSLLLGAAAGTFGLEHRRIPAGLFGAIAVAGGLAVSRDPLGNDGLGWMAAIASALAGWVAYELLLGRCVAGSNTRAPGGVGHAREPHQGGLAPAEGSAPRFARDQFVRWAAGAGAVAVLAAVAGRWLRRGTSVGAARAEIASMLAAAATRAGEPAPPPVAGLPGLSSYITPNRDFYRIDTALSVPQIDPARWRLQITGMVEKPYELSLEEILQGGLEEHTVTLSCVSNEIGGDLVGNAVWTGIPLHGVLERAGIKEGADQIAGRSVDGWSAGFPTSLVNGERTAMIAVGMNGEPLPTAHGFPARLIIAGLYGYVSAVKWLSAIELTTWDAFDGYWIPRGWSKLGPIKTSSRIDTPRDGSRHRPGTVGIGGVAWAPTRGIGSVELQLDQGEWVEAQLAQAVSDETWVQWTHQAHLEPGPHTIRVRAYDLNGEPQPPGPKGPAPNGAEGYHTVTFTVDQT